MYSRKEKQNTIRLMIFDCFLFFNEFDQLKIRCEEFKDLEVTHVLLEAPMTHSGNPKPLYFEERKHEFSEYNIVSFGLHYLPKPDYFAIEKYSRNYLKSCLEILGVQDDDTIILADTDECPLRSTIASFIENKYDFAAIKMAFGRYYFNTIKKELWDRCRVFTGAYMKDKDMETIRNSGYENVLYGGLHASFCGSIDEIQNKIESYSHQEYNNPSFLSREKWELLIEGLLDPFDKTPLKKINPESHILPRYIRDNHKSLEKYIKL